MFPVLLAPSGATPFHWKAVGASAPIRLSVRKAPPPPLLLRGGRFRHSGARAQVIRTPVRLGGISSRGGSGRLSLDERYLHVRVHHCSPPLTTFGRSMSGSETDREAVSRGCTVGRDDAVRHQSLAHVGDPSRSRTSHPRTLSEESEPRPRGRAPPLCTGQAALTCGAAAVRPLAAPAWSPCEPPTSPTSAPHPRLTQTETPGHRPGALCFLKNRRAD